MTEPKINQWITEYLKLGWFLLPIIPNEKIPYIKWKHRRDQKPDLKEIQSWLKNWPQMNLAVATGKLSQVVVMDFDGLEGLTFLRQNRLTSSVQSITGKGKQLYYKWETEIRGSVSEIAPNVDIRGDGDIAIIPPSIHPNGRIYRWKKFQPMDLQNFPSALIVSKDTTSQISVGKERLDSLRPESRPRLDIAKALEEMKIGNIDDTLVSILGRMRRDGWSDSDALALLEPVSREKGATEGHLEEKIRNIWSRYEPKTSGGNSVQSYQNGVYEQSPSLSIHSPADDDSFNKFSESMASISPRSGINTGFPTLDRYFEGGLKSERLFTVAARTGTGKTNFAIALAASLCQQGKKVLLFSTEFQYNKIWSRFLPYIEIGRFRDLPFYVCDSFSPRIEQVEEAIKRIMPDVFIFDHINHIGEERESLGTFMQGANFLQRKYNCQGIMVAQLNRAADWVENGKRVEPRMSMIKGSGTIEQASSRVLLLSETRVTPEYNEILGMLDKNDSGDRGLINFGLYKNPYILRELK